MPFQICRPAWHRQGKQRRILEMELAQVVQNDPDWYPDVYFIEQFMDELDEEDFYFVRVGEDYEDNEIRGELYDNPFGIYLTRE